MGNFRVGDKVSGLESDLRGTVVKILDAGYLMIHVEEYDMEVNLHEDELVKSDMQATKISSPKPKSEDITHHNQMTTTLDLHLGKNKSGSQQHPLELQLNKLRSFLSLSVQNRVARITVIHGKGKGRLHQACLQFLRSDKRVKKLEILRAALHEPHGIIVYLR